MNDYLREELNNIRLIQIMHHINLYYLYWVNTSKYLQFK